MSHQNVTLHLYFSLHSELNFHFLKQNHVFSQKEMFVSVRQKNNYACPMKYSFTECESEQ